MRVAVVGGGPGGLYFARLLKRGRPQARVEVFEQNPAEATFGFGVTLGGSSLERLAQADPAVAARLADAMLFEALQMIRLDGAEAPIEYARPGGSIGRLTLLAILRAACLEVGVEVHHGVRIERSDSLVGYDLIVAADGVNSALRQEQPEAFGTSTRILTNHFAWYGVGRAMRPSALVFRRALGGRFIAHYYAYTDAMSTFVAECDDATWHVAGLATMSDGQRRGVFEQVFAPELDGAALIENRSIWRQFPVITNRCWFSGTVVLIGDALRSAHFSIGSGTRLAMEDAQVLFEACCQAPDIAAALALFVARRGPARAQFGAAAERSFGWYERIGAAMEQPVLDFAYDFLTRTGRVDDQRLLSYAPKFAERYRARRQATVDGR
jgi:2-polyprenyl-6-methoxyphenol hydroxylase-like FAD-dependent oxidoreductase